ncbi:hypothetical protein ACVWW9_002802 [Agrococcus sp. UYP33]
MVWPRSTRAPATTDGSTGSKLDTSPPACSIETTGRPATGPAKRTTPRSGATTTDPTGAAMSMPRCPAP